MILIRSELAGTFNYATARSHVPSVGTVVADFIRWLSSITGVDTRFTPILVSFIFSWAMPVFFLILAPVNQAAESISSGDAHMVGLCCSTQSQSPLRRLSGRANAMESRILWTESVTRLVWMERWAENPWTHSLVVFTGYLLPVHRHSPSAPSSNWNKECDRTTRSSYLWFQFSQALILIIVYRQCYQKRED